MPAKTFEQILKMTATALIPSITPTVQYPDRVDYWKKEIEKGHDRPILVGADDKSRILDGNHTMTAYKELGKTPRIYEMDENTFWNESEGYKDKLDYVKQAIKDGKAKEIKKNVVEVVEEITERIKADDAEKFNPYHDRLGRFTTANGAASMTTRTRDPKKQHMADMAIAREKQRQGAAGGAGSSQNGPVSEEKPLDFPGNKATQSAHHKDTPGDMENMFDDDSARQCIELAQEITGVDLDTAASFYGAVQSFTGGGYYSIREYYQNGNTWSKREAENLEQFIKDSPKWDGGNLYRGIAIDKATADMIINTAKEGKTMGMMGPSSWSSRHEIADSFATTSPGEVKIIFQTKGKQNGTSVKYMSVNSHEDEVVCSNDARWKPTKVSQRDDGVYVIDCDPIYTTKKSYDEIEEVQKFNPYHGPDGKFSSANGAHSFTYAPGKSRAHDLAIEREKKRQASAGSAGGSGSSGDAVNQETREHLPFMNNKEAVANTMKECNVSEQEAKDMVKEIDAYAEGYAYEMRNWQKTGEAGTEMTEPEVKNMEAQVEKFIKKSPKWGGGELYRGISVSEADVRKILLSQELGKSIDMKGTSSWSSDRETADDFGRMTAGGDDVTIIFKTPGTKKGTSIDHISEFSQSEVLISKDAKWDIKNIDGSFGEKYFEVELEERP